MQLTPIKGFQMVNAGVIYQSHPGRHRGFRLDPLVLPDAVVLFGQKRDKDLPSRVRRYGKELKQTARPLPGAPDNWFTRALERLTR